jgi:hypothetical protein
MSKNKIYMLATLSSIKTLKNIAVSINILRLFDPQRIWDMCITIKSKQRKVIL